MIFTFKKTLRIYLSTILENIPIERLENATQNQENDQRIPHLRCLSYYKTVQKCWRDGPKSEINWKRLFNDQTLEFSTIYQKKILDIKENKLAEFNYKVLHNILPCGVNLYMWRIIDTKKCDICNIDEDISHLLYNCEIANSIWRIVSKIVQRNISVIDVIISEHCEPHIVDVITIICYGIFKYWILSKNTKTKRNVNTFLASLRAYINYRCMYDLHWQNLYLNKDTVNILKRIRDISINCYRPFIIVLYMYLTCVSVRIICVIYLWTCMHAYRWIYNKASYTAIILFIFRDTYIYVYTHFYICMEKVLRTLLLE